MNGLRVVGRRVAERDASIVPADLGYGPAADRARSFSPERILSMEGSRRYSDDPDKKPGLDFVLA